MKSVSEEVTREERLRRLEDMHGGVSLGDRAWAADKIRGLEAYSETLEGQNRLLKEQLSIWKRKAGENQLIAGRWQYLFEQAQKMVNHVDDIFEYTYKSMTPKEIKTFIVSKLDDYSTAVAQIRKSPTEQQEQK